MHHTDQSSTLQYSKSPNKYAGETPMTQATTNYQDDVSFAGGVPDLSGISPYKNTTMGAN